MGQLAKALSRANYLKPITDMIKEEIEKKKQIQLLNDFMNNYNPQSENTTQESPTLVTDMVGRYRNSPVVQTESPTLITDMVGKYRNSPVVQKTPISEEDKMRNFTKAASAYIAGGGNNPNFNAIANLVKPTQTKWRSMQNGNNVMFYNENNPNITKTSTIGTTPTKWGSKQNGNDVMFYNEDNPDITKRSTIGTPQVKGDGKNSNPNNNNNNNNNTDSNTDNISPAAKAKANVIKNMRVVDALSDELKNAGNPNDDIPPEEKRENINKLSTAKITAQGELVSAAVQLTTAVGIPAAGVKGSPLYILWNHSHVNDNDSPETKRRKLFKTLENLDQSLKTKLKPDQKEAIQLYINAVTR